MTGAVAGLRVLDAESGAAVQKWPDVWPLLALRLSADGARLVGESADGSTRTWEVATGDELASFRRAGVVPRHIDISPDGSRVLAGSFDGGVQLWDPATGARLLYVIGHNGYPWAARFCGRADRFVIGSGRGVRLWDAGTGLDLVTVNVPDAGPLAVACSPDGLTLATAAGDGMARVWNLEAKEGAAFFVGADVRDVEFTSDAAALITRHADGAARVWDLAGQRELIALGSARGSSDVAFSPAGTRLVAPAGDTGTIAIWDVPPGSGGAPSPGREAGGWRRYDLAAHANFVSRIAFAPTGRFAAASHDQTVSVWDVRADRLAPVRVAELPAGRAPVLDLAFSGDGARLATVTEVAVEQWEPAYSPASQTVLLAASDLPVGGLAAGGGAEPERRAGCRGSQRRDRARSCRGWRASPHPHRTRRRRPGRRLQPGWQHCWRVRARTARRASGIRSRRPSRTNLPRARRSTYCGAMRRA